ncbi:MAG: hypothetical protein U1F87_18600 [Kiritimatiellia bacterium]
MKTSTAGILAPAIRARRGLAGKRFPETAGVLTPSSYGLVSTGGISRTAWRRLRHRESLAAPAARALRRPARLDSFQTAFHNQNNNDLSKFSTGDYIYPDSENAGLAGFSFIAQAQTRKASIFKRVDQWASAPPRTVTPRWRTSTRTAWANTCSSTSASSSCSSAAGSHDRRLLDPGTDSNRIYQVVGNFASYAGVGDDTEGFPNTASAAVNADRVGTYRASALKDWWAASGAGGASFADPVYLGSTGPGGVTLATAGGNLQDHLAGLRHLPWRR